MILQALKLPKHLQCCIKLSKKAFIEHTKQKNVTQRLLQEHVANIQIIAHLTPDNSNIPAYKNQHQEYLELMVLQCELKETDIRSSQLNALHRLFHQHIPYPLIVEISSPQQEQVQWSLAHKSINQADTESALLVLSDIHTSNWLSTSTPDALTKELKRKLKIDQQNHSHFFALYDSLVQHLIGFLLAVNLNKNTLAEASATYSTKPQQDETLKKVKQLKNNIAALENKRGKTTQFNEKVALNLEVQKLKKQLAIIKQHT
jgi:hypothetical protein